MAALATGTAEVDAAAASTAAAAAAAAVPTAAATPATVPTAAAAAAAAAAATAAAAVSSPAATAAAAAAVPTYQHMLFAQRDGLTTDDGEAWQYQRFDVSDALLAPYSVSLSLACVPKVSRLYLGTTPMRAVRSSHHQEQQDISGA